MKYSINLFGFMVDCDLKINGEHFGIEIRRKIKRI